MPITKLSIGLRTAERAAEAAASKAREIGIAISIAVVDEAGDLCAFRRMDGAPRLTIEIATNKAYTSASFGMPTHAWWDLIKDDAPLLHGITHTPRLVIFGGGFPIMEDGQKIGAIGISGGHYTQDMECAPAALDAIGDSSSGMLGKKHA
jgi:uncharacterized protein GlcG (DUF336 family)